MTLFYLLNVSHISGIIHCVSLLLLTKVCKLAIVFVCNTCIIINQLLKVIFQGNSIWKKTLWSHQLIVRCLFEIGLKVLKGRKPQHFKFGREVILIVRKTSRYFYASKIEDRGTYCFCPLCLFVSFCLKL